MSTLKEYFEKNRYMPKFLIGERVRGLYNNLPFAGTVLNDFCIDEDEGPKVAIHLDLPIKHENAWTTIIFIHTKSKKKNYLIEKVS